ncbi:MAG: ABC transporter ATP-binding protein [Planctomycetota bacterium]|nr:ABC transporter ATP-binding protein [Planctomycetota bacterium]
MSVKVKPDNRQDVEVIRVRGLRKVFRDFWLRPRVEALREVDLTIYSGEVFGLLGPNGSGKSTTIQILLGLLFPSAGEVSVLGKPPATAEIKNRIGYLPEDSVFYPFLTGREMLDLSASLAKVADSQRKGRIEDLLEMVGLQDAGDREIGDYSKGMQRRIGIAQALIHDPEILILDEPTNGLDPLGVREMKDWIGALRQRGKTVLISSHLLADVEQICDRVSILYGGKVQTTGSIEQILARDDRTLWVTSNPGEDLLAEARRQIEKSGIEVVSMGPGSRSLEDKFLETVEAARESGEKTTGAGIGAKLPAFIGQSKVPR